MQLIVKLKKIAKLMYLEADKQQIRYVIKCFKVKNKIGYLF